jgi:hypothetical protein
MPLSSPFASIQYQLSATTSRPHSRAAGLHSTGSGWFSLHKHASSAASSTLGAQQFARLPRVGSHQPLGVASTKVQHRALLLPSTGSGWFNHQHGYPSGIDLHRAPAQGESACCTAGESTCCTAGSAGSLLRAAASLGLTASDSLDCGLALSPVPVWRLD